MSQTPSSGSSDRQWNLGKSRPSSSARNVPPPQAKGADASAPPAAPAKAATAAATDKVLDSIMSEEDQRPPIGRAIPESKGIRGALNHPLVMAGSGLVLVIAIVYLISGGSLAWIFGGRSANFILPPTPEERAASLVAGIGAQQSAAEGRARLLMMGGQIIDATGRFSATPIGRQEGGEVNYEFIPEHLSRMRMPSPDSPEFIEFRLRWDEQARSAIEMGQQVIRTARENNVNAETLRNLGARLRAEGLAALDDVMEGSARSGISGIDGARARLLAGTNLMTEEEAQPLIELLLTDPLGERIRASRAASDAAQATEEEEAAQP